jgi:predicted MFS family arabinose efflux permease
MRYPLPVERWSDLVKTDNALHPAVEGSGRRDDATRRGAAAVFQSWRFPDYRRLWFCVVVANSGRWILALGAGWLLFNLTHSSLWVGASFFTIQGPALLISPLAGVWADRYDRRLLLALALALAAFATGMLALLTLLGLATLGPVLACTLLCGVAFSVQGTAWGSLLPGVVPRDTLPNAVALQGTARQGAEFLGPALASPLLVTAGPSAVFACAACCYGGAVLLALRIAVRRAPHLRSRERPFAPLRDGLRYALAVPLLGSVVLLVAFHCSLTMTYQGMLPQFAGNLLAGDGKVYGALMTAVGIGAIAGTLTLAAVANRRYGSGYIISALASGAALLALGRSGNVATALVAASAVGASQAVFMAISLTFLQQLAADAYLGRVTGLYNFLASGTMAFLSLGLGTLAGRIVPAVLMTITGGGFVLVVLAMLAAPAFRQLCRGVTAAELAELGLT